MILRFEHLSKHPAVFRTMTGLSLSQWSELLRDVLLRDVLPRHTRAKRERLLGALPEAQRQRAFGGGQQGALEAADQVLLAVVWLRQYPTNEVLGYLFGVSDSTVSRLVQPCASIQPVLKRRAGGLHRSSGRVWPGVG